MNREIAELTAKAAFRSSSDLNDVIPTLKDNLSEDEYSVLVRKIAAISASINLEILRPIFDEHPDLEAEFDRKIGSFGRLF